MSNYPPRSTAKVYHDIEGSPCTLRHLIKHEPEWAHSCIQAMEAALKRLGSMEAFTLSGTVDKSRDAELIARIDFARSLINQ